MEICMIIEKIIIKSFGLITDMTLEFSDKVNGIEGQNESGKSTVLLFIKYMLYGLGRKAASNPDRERSLSWSGHTAAGSMTFEHGGTGSTVGLQFFIKGAVKEGVFINFRRVCRKCEQGTEHEQRFFHFFDPLH